MIPTAIIVLIQCSYFVAVGIGVAFHQVTVGDIQWKSYFEQNNTNFIANIVYISLEYESHVVHSCSI